MSKVLIIDTCILCVLLKVPHMETCGRNDDKWDFTRVNSIIESELGQKTTLVLPIATLIESGNHITNHGNYTHASELIEILKKSINEETPWAAFSDQSALWSEEELDKLAAEWPDKCKSIGLGDMTITAVANHYAKSGYTVELLTADSGLKAYEPLPPTSIPRRNRK
ncbi:hypothetical protein [Desulfovibrio subterraneus]|uniref:PIN domain-containing protein n=1 Tax=Desulfovibrio subterraneus TaxID=2718620 RepID=A0A7J0BK55_9BACT|nr:hypothetical protein [Desulfovibrio subterraneus]GFM34060.1 hypothetical protein DSM101010T_24250 [Desulfovibrio subterraneus]